MVVEFNCADRDVISRKRVGIKTVTRHEDNHIIKYNKKYNTKIIKMYYIIYTHSYRSN